MNLIFLIIILSILVCSIEIYSEFHLQNYGTFIERIFYILSIKSLFIFFKFSCLLSFLYIIFDLNLYYNTPDLIEHSILNVSWGKWYLYIIAPILFWIITISSNSRELSKHFLSEYIYNSKRSQFLVSIKYLLVRLFSFIIAFIVFKFVFRSMLTFHELFISQKLYIFDWLVFDTNKVDNYNKGVYFSLTLTIVIFLLFNNAFLKNNSELPKYRGPSRYREINFNYFKYFLISLLLVLGTFFGFFSIFNGIHNIVNIGISEWVTKENVLGILPIRVSSILILYYLLTYIYYEVLHCDIANFLRLAIFPIRKVPSYESQISFAKRETLFFSQIGFYVLNIALAELFIILGFKNLFLSILNFAILFILDDFKIINDYSNGLNRVSKSHFIRISVFNLLMLVVAVILLFSKEYYALLLGYFILFLILFWYYIKNSSYISIGGFRRIP